MPMDDALVFGLGALPSPADDRDWKVSDLYAALALDAAPLPDSYTAPVPYPPVLNQGVTPQCVAYSSAAMKRYMDLRDQSDFDSDEALFFAQIGGTPSGAVTRNALDRLLSDGYPVVGAPQLAGVHRIAAYYAVPVTREDICRAIASLGPVLLAVNWASSWFRPVAGVLPPWDSLAGGHALIAVGWTPDGLLLRNSWGPSWGIGGQALMRWADLSHVRECWRAQDQIVPPPVKAWAVRVQHGATVMQAHLTETVPPLITGWTNIPYTGGAVTWKCSAPRVLKGSVSGQAPTVRLMSGPLKGKYIRSSSPGVALV